MTLFPTVSVLLCMAGGSAVCTAAEKVSVQEVVPKVDTARDVTIADLKTEQQSFIRQLQRVGSWLRNHKYHEIDQRYSYRGEENLQPYFFQSFPEPPLHTVHASLAARCREGLITCVEEIYDHTVGVASPYEDFSRESLDVATLPKSDDMWKMNHVQPFDSRLELFEYRTAASYFMCFYTLQQTELLRKFYHVCHDTAVTRAADRQLRVRVTYDYRRQDYDFSCALLSFCPDVCCGGVSGELRKDGGRGLGNG